MPHSDLYSQIDRAAYTNALSKNSPVTKMFFALSALIICVSSQSIVVPIIVFAVATTLLLKRAKVKTQLYRDMLIYPTVMVALSCLFIALFFGYGQALTEVSLPWFTWIVFKNGMTLSINTFFRVEGALSCLYFLVLTTSITDIFITLRRLHVPRVVVEIALLIYRYIFVIIEVSAKMNTAQKLRLGYSGWTKRIRSIALISANLFIRSLEQGERTFIAMNARGYDGFIRVLEDLPRPKKTALLGIFLFDGFLVLAILFTTQIGVV
jgi:cobalt/nickel transport system permease protein